MNKNIEMIDREIESRFEKLKTVTSGSEASEFILKEITTLTEMRIKTHESMLSEGNDKTKLILDQVSTYAKLSIDILAITLPLAFYAKWMKAGFEFEQTGIFTSQTFKGLFGNFKPKK